MKNEDRKEEIEVTPDGALQMDELSDMSDEERNVKHSAPVYERGLPVPYRQREMYGCGSYALANLFNNAGYLEFIVPDQGDTVALQNKKLSAVDPEFYLEALYTTQAATGGRLDFPDLFSSVVVSEEMLDSASAFLMVFFRPNLKLTHYVLLLQNHRNGLFYVVDSREEFILKYKLEDLLSTYWITAIEYFGLYERGDGETVSFDKSHLPHIFPPGE